LLFGGTGVLNLGPLTLARQTLYHLSHTPSFCALVIFQVEP
jgi:hypothetical protein